MQVSFTVYESFKLIAHEHLRRLVFMTPASLVSAPPTGGNIAHTCVCVVETQTLPRNFEVNARSSNIQF